MFEWQKYSQESSSVPHYGELLEFIDLRAQASQVSVADSGKKVKSEGFHSKKSTLIGKPVTSLAGTADPMPNCVVCT